ncbi:ABC transporter permease [Buchananella hordeovulneris]|uniref:ABC transporter permease n=1 Tax=Buchananella hordeovulneris TaxID=52770 RepID=UPI0026DDB990|nr:ABC transporter permease subunit [Buchananella hordeovulneris]MDO5079715.1 ABC transporter permease subunit [Buchananella hordeovulneris]
MSLLLAAWQWLIDPAHWSGPGAIPARVLEHLWVSLLAVSVASAIAWPVGVAVGHTRRGTQLVGALTGAARAVPTLGVLTLFALALGIGIQAPVWALVVLAVPSLLAGAYSGIQAIEPQIPLAAQAVGMNRWQVIWHVELPLGLPVLLGGLRSALLQVISTATLAAYTADIGLGRYVFAGLKSRDYPQMLAGALLVTALALLAELTLAKLQKIATSRAYPQPPIARR